MRQSTLLSPGKLTNALRLRAEVCNAISTLEVRGAHGVAESAMQDFSAFLQDAAWRAAQARRVTAPVVVGQPFAYAGAAKAIIIEFSTHLNPRTVPPGTAFTVAGKTVNGGAISGNRLIITVNAAMTANFSVSYTDPGTGDRLQDLSGNFVSSFTLTSTGVLRSSTL